MFASRGVVTLSPASSYWTYVRNFFFVVLLFFSFLSSFFFLFSVSFPISFFFFFFRLSFLVIVLLFFFSIVGFVVEPLGVLQAATSVLEKYLGYVVLLYVN